MLSQMQKQEEDDAAKDERDRKRDQKREEKAEKVAEASQRRATRGTAATTADANTQEKSLAGKSKSLPTRAKGKLRDSAISDYLKKKDIKVKGQDVDVGAALEEAVASDVKPGEIGMQDLHSARQPALVTGGTMRSYQLEGLEWLISLYENGLNGILADEMGLGKTIQTIAFLAFLREKATYGPFLIAAPLSTTTNWVDEFNKWTPSIPVVLYHGTKQEREEIRRKRLKRPGTADFPVVVTSYEICMNDRKFLAGFGWKFIIIVSSAPRRMPMITKPQY